ncbi:MAG TPA: prenyltransferase/squalene oxidase repeat-containing protein [Anaerolineae bacterium]|nr:prenyltransferase/squalene oxidase repeat-containing protein [Anaerolineae bacterium]HOQ99576.1 prenyltransferase/squalene oxidase repeat-containing protein [Anaerolineae bacterium]HPL27714.1 prenyltransferase/squalene oxidase repeat-containing protein [Anaerolineae bacterium]
MSHAWAQVLKLDPLPALLAPGDEARAYCVRRDLLGEALGPVEALWQLPAARRLVAAQGDDGAWPYPGARPDAIANYDLVETYRSLRLLVDMYGCDRRHPAIERAAAYVFSCQSPEGDIRGILGPQYMPYYHGAILELLVKAGYEEDTRVVRGLEWLLSMRQEDGGWIVPVQAVAASERTQALWRGAPVPPDRARPSAHLATGMALRALAAHPRYRSRPEAQAAGALLKGRFFRADCYNDRKAPAYWLKFQYPFWWTNLLTALDTLSLLGFAPDDRDIGRGLAWFLENQQADGLWPTSYDKGKQAAAARSWVGLAACRVLQRFYPGR